MGTEEYILVHGQLAPSEACNEWLKDQLSAAMTDPSTTGTQVNQCNIALTETEQPDMFMITVYGILMEVFKAIRPESFTITDPALYTRITANMAEGRATPKRSKASIQAQSPSPQIHDADQHLAQRSIEEELAAQMTQSPKHTHHIHSSASQGNPTGDFSLSDRVNLIPPEREISKQSMVTFQGPHEGPFQQVDRSL